MNSAQTLVEIASQRHEVAVAVAGLLPIVLIAVTLDAGLDRRFREVDRTSSPADVVGVRVVWSLVVIWTTLTEVAALDDIQSTSISTLSIDLLWSGVLATSSFLLMLLMYRIWRGVALAVRRAGQRGRAENPPTA